MVAVLEFFWVMFARPVHLLPAQGKSTGAAPVSRLFDQTAAYVSQGGVRRGSFAMYLPIDHPDVPEAPKGPRTIARETLVTLLTLT